MPRETFDNQPKPALREADVPRVTDSYNSLLERLSDWGAEDVKPLYWTDDHQRRALRDGWGLFMCEGYNEIQRYDDSSRFKSDAEAIAHVYWMAGRGDAVARTALLLTIFGAWRYTPQDFFPVKGG